MIRGLYTAVSGLITLEGKQDVISSNIANANTTGYKSEDLSIRKFKDVLIQNRDGVAAGNKSAVNVLGNLCLGSRIDETNVNFESGIMHETGKKTDFAINGSGFFEVRRGDQTLYTRDGNFMVNPRGELVTTTGENVVGIDANTGATQNIVLGNSKIELGEGNSLYVDGVLKYKLKIAEFADNKSIKKMGDNLYSAENPNYNNSSAAKQGFLEKSNVNITKEMIDMMTTMRSFETNQKVVQTIDETLSKAANEVGVVR